MLVGPFHEAQMEKGSRLNRVLEEVIHDFVRNPETLLWGQSHINSVINERFIWAAERQQDEWGTLKEMSRHPQVDPARVLAVLDVAEFRKTHNRLEAGLRLRQEPGDDTPVLEGYLYATRTEVPLGKARWFSWPLVGEEPLKERVGAALRALVNTPKNLESAEQWTLDEIFDYRCSFREQCSAKIAADELVQKYPDSEPAILFKANSTVLPDLKLAHLCL